MKVAEATVKYLISKLGILVCWHNVWNKTMLWLGNLFPDTAYSHHWLSVTIHLNRYNLTSDKFTGNGDKCKPLSFTAFAYKPCTTFFQPIYEMPTISFKALTDRTFPHGCYRTLVQTKVAFFFGFRRFSAAFLLIRSKKCVLLSDIRSEKCNRSCVFAWKNVFLHWANREKLCLKER